MYLSFLSRVSSQYRRTRSLCAILLHVQHYSTSCGIYEVPSNMKVVWLLTYTGEVGSESEGNWFLRRKVLRPLLSDIKLCMGMENHGTLYSKLDHVLKYPFLGSTFDEQFHLNKIGLPEIRKICATYFWIPFNFKKFGNRRIFRYVHF